MKTFAALLLIQLTITGCSLLPERSESSSKANAVIADDLVSVFAQLDALNPASAVLWLPNDFIGDESFSAELTRALRDAGYAMRIGGQAGSADSVAYSVSTHSSQSKDLSKTYTVTIGNVSVRRSYAETEPGSNAPYGLLPAGGMQVRGADASTLSIDENRFILPYGESRHTTTGSVPENDIESPALPSNTPKPATTPQVPVPAVELAPPAEVVVSVEPRIAAPNQQQPLLDIVAPSVVQSSNKVNQTDWKATLSQLAAAPTLNVRDLGQSNFADTFNELGIVGETILMFDNDSVYLGQSNKERVRRMVEVFNSDSDIFSVIGCSHGSTNLSMGQEGLALGRAARVVEELIYEGIPENSILDEGCWAPSAYDERMPRRGVVLALKRTIGSLSGS